ncbi:MAG: transcriptional regulator [Flavobacteriaceae bacterium]|nr:MAG: transcriptional regulator [Flavobacteriaceae bacterium]
MKAKDLLDTLKAEGRECEWLEFKENNDQPQLIGEYLSALSNAAALHGRRFGYLVYGIHNITHEVVGTDFDPWRAKGKGNEGLEPWLARLLEPRIDFHILKHGEDGKTIIIFKIDAVRERPVSFSGRAYIRIGEYKKALSEFPEKERKIWDITHSSSFESGVALEAQSEDDVLSKIDYPTFFDLLKIPLADNRKGILSKLEEEKVILAEGGRYAITNGGAILFAKDLNQFPTLIRRAVRVIVYSDETRLNAQKEQVGSKGYAIGFESLIDWIYDQLPANELIEDALRVEKRMYPKVAIREFVANALIHQDFSLKGTAPMIEIFASRMEITNPGTSLIDTSRFIDHAPRSRNEALAALMRRMNICEERGSGVDRAVSNIEVYQLPAPEFQSEDNYTRTTLFAYRKLRDMTKSDRVRACYQHCCLCWVARTSMTNASLRKRFGIEDKNYPMVSRIIKDALIEKMIKPVDSTGQAKQYAPFWA